MSTLIDAISTKFKYISITVIVSTVLLLIMSSIVYFSKDKYCSDESKKKNTDRALLGLFILSLILTVASVMLYIIPKFIIGDITGQVSSGLESVKNQLSDFSFDKYCYTH